MAPVASTSAVAIDAYDTAVSNYLGLTGAPVEALHKAIDADPAFIDAHALLLLLHVLGTGCTSEHPVVSQSLTAMRQLQSSASILPPRQSALIRACQLYAFGCWTQAASVLESYLCHSCAPHDALLLRALHDTYFFQGRVEDMRASLARRVPEWTRDMPEYHKLLGMTAFAFEEMNDYARAEELAAQSLSADPEDVWGMHALLHVYEMQCRVDEGRRVLTDMHDMWSSATLFSHHVHWHACIFGIESGTHTAALTRYDNHMTGKRAPTILNASDGASVLWRAHMCDQLGVSAQPQRKDRAEHRWREVWERFEVFSPARLNTHTYAYADTFMALTLAMCGNVAGARAHIQSMREYAQVHPQVGGSTPVASDATKITSADADNRLAAHVAGIQVAEGFVAAATGDYAAALDHLLATERLWQRLGGSHAQRDVFTQTLIFAAIMGGRFDVARERLAERVTMRFASPSAWNLYSKVLLSAGDVEASSHALERAHAMGFGQTGPVY